MDSRYEIETFGINGSDLDKAIALAKSNMDPKSTPANERLFVVCASPWKAAWVKGCMKSAGFKAHRRTKTVQVLAPFMALVDALAQMREYHPDDTPRTIDIQEEN